MPAHAHAENSGKARLPAPGPWSSGPAEILKFAEALVGAADDTSRRIGMILIDNAVELTLNVYVGLPSRANGLGLARKEVDVACSSFGGVLDAMEKCAPEAFDGINLSDLEWYHRLRNQLYHEGNGLTVEQGKARAFAALARALQSRLFGDSPTGLNSDLQADGAKAEQSDAVAFLRRWAALFDGRRPLEGGGDRGLSNQLQPADQALFLQTRAVRNRLAHGAGTPTADDFVALDRLEEAVASLTSSGACDRP